MSDTSGCCCVEAFLLLILLINSVQTSLVVAAATAGGGGGAQRALGPAQDAMTSAQNRIASKGRVDLQSSTAPLTGAGQPLWLHQPHQQLTADTGSGSSQTLPTADAQLVQLAPPDYNKAKPSPAATAFVKNWTNAVLLKHELTNLCLTKFGGLAACSSSTRPRRARPSAMLNNLPGGADRFVITLQNKKGLVAAQVAGGGCLVFNATTNSFTWKRGFNSCLAVNDTGDGLAGPGGPAPPVPAVPSTMAEACNLSDPNQLRAIKVTLNKDWTRQMVVGANHVQAADSSPPLDGACSVVSIALPGGSNITTILDLAVGQTLSSIAAGATAQGSEAVPSCSSLSSRQDSLPVPCSVSSSSLANAANSVATAGEDGLAEAAVPGRRLLLDRPPRPSNELDPVGFNYIGCFKDKKNRDPVVNQQVRAMKGPIGPSIDMNIATCARIAAIGGNQFFAVQQETLPPSPVGCYVSNDLPAATRYGRTSDDKACQTPCASNPNDVCGGFTANALYQVAPDGPEIAYIAVFSADNAVRTSAPIEDLIAQLRSAMTRDDIMRVELILFQQVGADQLSDSARATLERHGWNSNTFVRQQAARAGADITLIVVPASLPGSSIGYHPMRSHFLSVRNGRRPLEWAIGVIKADALGSYAPLSILGFTFGLLSNQEITPPGVPYHAHSWAPWLVLDGHCELYQGWCWHWHHIAGAVSIMSDGQPCNARLPYPRVCQRVLKFGANKVTVRDIPTSTDPSGGVEHHSHQVELGDGTHDPLKALLSTWPLITNYRSHGCKWLEGMVVNTAVIAALGRSSMQDLIGGVAWLGVPKKECADTCQRNGLWQSTRFSSITSDRWWFNEPCSAVMWEAASQACYFFRGDSYTFFYQGGTTAAKRRC
eukprot:gene6459-6688_t